MKKTILIMLISLLSLSYALACEDINYSVSYMEKTNEGCIEGLTLSLFKEGCDSSCFAEFDKMTYSTNSGYSKSFNTTSYASQITNPFVIIIKSFNCSADKPTYDFYADLYGDRNCSLTFRLDEEYIIYLKNIEEQKNAQEEIKTYEEEQRPAGEGGQKGPTAGGQIPSETLDFQKPPQNQTLKTTYSDSDVSSMIIAPQEVTDQAKNTRIEEALGKDENDTVPLPLLAGLIGLIIIISLLIMMILTMNKRSENKKKRKGLRIKNNQ